MNNTNTNLTTSMLMTNTDDTAVNEIVARDDKYSRFKHINTDVTLLLVNTKYILSRYKFMYNTQHRCCICFSSARYDNYIITYISCTINYICDACLSAFGVNADIICSVGGSNTATNMIVNNVIYYYVNKLLCIKHLCSTRVLIDDVYDIIAKMIAVMSVRRYV